MNLANLKQYKKKFKLLKGCDVYIRETASKNDTLQKIYFYLPALKVAI